MSNENLIELRCLNCLSLYKVDDKEFLIEGGENFCSMTCEEEYLEEPMREGE